MHALNETHDPQLQSWVASANDGQTDFPIQNLPFAIFRRQGSNEAFRGGVAIGDQIVDMAAAVKAGVFTGDALEAAQAAAEPTLNHLMGLGPQRLSHLRKQLSKALQTGSAQEAALQACLVPQAQAEYALPARIGDYTDFYTSVHHATNIGKQFRPDNPLLPNYKWVPIGYHGRSSSIGVSGQSFKRPKGQVKPPDADAPVLKPSARMDIELEMGVFVGQANELGEPVPMTDAEDHIFGLVLFNDWSADNSAQGGLDIHLEALIETPKMRDAKAAPARFTQTNYRHAYWTAAQMVAHHTVNGCNLQPGDLLGTGTLSGPTLDQACALIELTTGGKNPIQLPNGESRTWLEDGDTIILRGWCEKPGAARIGFGECVGTVLPAT